jgi:hypothetical protein
VTIFAAFSPHWCQNIKLYIPTKFSYRTLGLQVFWSGAGKIEKSSALARGRF